MDDDGSNGRMTKNEARTIQVCHPPSSILHPSSIVTFHIHGGRPLSGTVAAGGSKNATLPMMAASILADGPVRLEGVPRLADVDTLSLVLERLGVRAAWTPCGLTLETVDPGRFAPSTTW